MVDAAPLIVTAMLGSGDQRRFDALRAAHFPPERNYLAAHLTLFHHLPPARLDELLRLLKQLASAPAPAARVSEVYALGRGVAFRIEAPGLVDCRDRVAEWFAADLTPQDRTKARLHITVQNKVDPAEARALLAELTRDFQPAPLAITGFAIYYYRGGPWDLVAQIPFRGEASGRY